MIFVSVSTHSTAVNGGNALFVLNYMSAAFALWLALDLAVILILGSSRGAAEVSSTEELMPTLRIGAAADTL